MKYIDKIYYHDNSNSMFIIRIYDVYPEIDLLFAREDVFLIRPPVPAKELSQTGFIYIDCYPGKLSEGLPTEQQDLINHFIKK